MVVGVRDSVLWCGLLDCVGFDMLVFTGLVVAGNACFVCWCGCLLLLCSLVLVVLLVFRLWLSCI